MAGSKYTVDLSAHLADCELNYLRLCKLMPEMAAGDELEIGVLGSVLRFHVRERAPYTAMLDVQQDQPHIGSLPALRLQVRVYHDAAVAEVTACDQTRRVQPRHDYPNPHMHQRDEKRQWNRFLGEWLQQCLSHGHSVDNPVNLLEM